MEFDRSHFWKPEESHSRSHSSQKQQELSFRESEAEGGVVYVHNAQQHFSIKQQREGLPIFQFSMCNQSLYYHNRSITRKQEGKFYI